MLSGPSQIKGDGNIPASLSKSNNRLLCSSSLLIRAAVCTVSMCFLHSSAYPCAVSGLPSFEAMKSTIFGAVSASTLTRVVLERAIVVFGWFWGGRRKLPTFSIFGGLPAQIVMPDIASMDFVALLSGGKDSCYNIYQCQKYGHCLVCVANLHPPVESDELNSFMYQCAGASAIPAIAECLGVPLIRREIHGKAKDMSLEYDQRSCEDEVEDLYELLVDVLQRYPTVKGVSCGAIISSYQRFRVENICQRLGLTMLAYLWQRDRPQLIREIVSAGFDVVLVKVSTLQLLSIPLT